MSELTITLIAIGMLVAVPALMGLSNIFERYERPASFRDAVRRNAKNTFGGIVACGLTILLNVIFQRPLFWNWGWADFIALVAIAALVSISFWTAVDYLVIYRHEHSDEQ